MTVALGNACGGRGETKPFAGQAGNSTGTTTGESSGGAGAGTMAATNGCGITGMGGAETAMGTTGTPWSQ